MTGGLPLCWKLLLGIAGPALTLVLAWMSIKQNSQCWFAVALIVGSAWAVLQGVDYWLVSRFEESIRLETSTLVAYLDEQIQLASQIEQEVRGDGQAAERFEYYRDKIEGWRTKTGNELERIVPSSGAQRIFLSALGQPGATGLWWEYWQLRSCQGALMSILGASDGFVRRSRALAKETKP